MRHHLEALEKNRIIISAGKGVWHYLFLVTRNGRELLLVQGDFEENLGKRKKGEE